VIALISHVCKVFFIYRPQRWELCFSKDISEQIISKILIIAVKPVGEWLLTLFDWCVGPAGAITNDKQIASSYWNSVPDRL
jgi:hypothetical protein